MQKKKMINTISMLILIILLFQITQIYLSHSSVKNTSLLQAASSANRKNVIYEIELMESLISSEISIERNTFRPSNKSCKSPLVMWKHIHLEQNVLLYTGGNHLQRINCGKLGRLPGFCIAMNQKDWL